MPPIPIEKPFPHLAHWWIRSMVCLLKYEVLSDALNCTPLRCCCYTQPTLARDWLMPLEVNQVSWRKGHVFNLLNVHLSVHRSRVTCLLSWSPSSLTTSAPWLQPPQLSRASSSPKGCPTSQVLLTHCILHASCSFFCFCDLVYPTLTQGVLDIKTLVQKFYNQSVSVNFSWRMRYNVR